MKGLLGVFMLMSVALFAPMGAQEIQTEPRQGGAMPMTSMMQMMQNCPMNVQGAEVAVADTSNGIALTITTKSENVDELRRRVERMANMHTNPPANPSAMPGKMTLADAKFEAIPNGARLTLTPGEPARLTEFRNQVRGHVEEMKKEGGCTKMKSMMQEKAAAEAKPEPKTEESEVDHGAHHPGTLAK